ncbi:MAG: DCC1-like thiol-disulfide oxidoreductase family protein [Ignavibacterium sp.]
MKSKYDNVILYDGNCGFCNFWLSFIKKKDTHHKLNYYSLQSDTGNEILDKLKIQQQNIDTIIFIEGKELNIKSEAILKILNNLNLKLRFLIKIFPKFIRDFIYDLVSKNRYIFQKNKSCLFN